MKTVVMVAQKILAAKLLICIVLFLIAVFVVVERGISQNVAERTFDPDKDLLSLHYDHAPDKDDGQSAAADRTLLQFYFGVEWISRHVIPVSGTYGENAETFNPASDSVMDAAWNNCGGWLAAHTARKEVLTELTGRWTQTLAAGGDIWVKEGGQSDLTAEVIKRIHSNSPKYNLQKRVHLVQHSDWNEDKTTDSALTYVKKNAHYIRIKDANAYLNRKGGDERFEKAALQHPLYGVIWKSAFDYYDPKERLDFSDTGELMYILGLGEIGIDAFRERYLERN